MEYTLGLYIFLLLKMAARSSAAASLAQDTSSVVVNTNLRMTCGKNTNERCLKYSVVELLGLRFKEQASLSPPLKTTLGRLKLLRTMEWCKRLQLPGRKRKRCARGQKRGKRAGLLAKLKSRGGRPALPSLFLSNVRALENKVDLLKLRLRQREMKNCCALILCETWLKDSVPDSALHLDGLLMFRADRNHQSGKTRGGGLCIYINKGWCTNCTLVGSN